MVKSSADRCRSLIEAAGAKHTDRPTARIFRGIVAAASLQRVEERENGCQLSIGHLPRHRCRGLIEGSATGLVVVGDLIGSLPRPTPAPPARPLCILRIAELHQHAVAHIGTRAWHRRRDAEPCSPLAERCGAEQRRHCREHAKACWQPVRA